MTPVATRRHTCRVCGAGPLVEVLDLGEQPLANALVADPLSTPRDPTWPLTLGRCPSCGHVQLLHTVPPAVLFTDYPYLTGTSDDLRAHFEAYAAEVLRRLPPQPAEGAVVEIGCNDGSLLRCFRRAGLPTWGVEPAEAPAARARAEGLDVVSTFFDGAAGARLRGERGPARLVLANNVLAHVDDPVDFLAGCRALLAPGAWVVVEVPSLAALTRDLLWDTLYHEHLSTFSATTLEHAAERAGLHVHAVDAVPVHGGSLRVWMCEAPPPSAAPWRAREVAAGLFAPDTWSSFATRAQASRWLIREAVEALGVGGRPVVGYGAPAKATLLLNTCGLGPDLIPFTVDRNPLKVGRLIPGVRVPIRDVSALAASGARVALLLPWNLAGEVRRQQAAWVEAGGRFLVPLPSPRLQ